MNSEEIKKKIEELKKLQTEIRIAERESRRKYFKEFCMEKYMDGYVIKRNYGKKIRFDGEKVKVWKWLVRAKSIEECMESLHNLIDDLREFEEYLKNEVTK
jgi:hypothetical protein